MEKIFGRFTIENELGHGSFGKVFRVFDEIANEYRALKIIELNWVKPHLIERYKREFLLLSRMPHPRLVRVYDFFSEDNRIFISMELIESKPFTDENLSLKDKLELLCDIAEGLTFIHNRGIIHCDIKPSNIFLTEDGAKVGDFGLAHSISDSTEVLSGTAAYMDPYVLTGHKPNLRSDLYSFGVLALELLTGKNPFFSDTLSETIDLQLNLPITEIYFNTLLDSYIDVKKILLSLVEKNPFRRPLHMRDVWSIFLQTTRYGQNVDLTISSLSEPILVGREKVMLQFTHYVTRFLGKNIFSLAGKNGCGYSRILEEFRIIAQVENLRTLLLTSSNTYSSLLTSFLCFENNSQLFKYLPTLLWIAPELEAHPVIVSNRITKTVIQPDNDEIDVYLLTMIENLSYNQKIVIFIEEDVSPKFIEILTRRPTRGNILLVCKNYLHANDVLTCQTGILSELSDSEIVTWITSILGEVHGEKELLSWLNNRCLGLPKAIALEIKKLLYCKQLSFDVSGWKFSPIISLTSDLIEDSTRKQIKSFIEIAEVGLPYFVCEHLFGSEIASICIADLLAAGEIFEGEKWGYLAYFPTSFITATNIIEEHQKIIRMIAETLVLKQFSHEYILFAAQLFLQCSDYESASKYARASLKRLREKHDFDLLFNAYSIVEICANKLMDSELWFRAMKRHAFTYTEIGDFVSADKIYQQIFSETIDNSDLSQKTIILNDWASVLINMRQYDIALTYLTEARELAAQIEDVRLETFALTNIGVILQKKNDFSEAANMFWQARNLAVRSENLVGLCAIEINLGMIFSNQGIYDKAIDRFMSAITVSDNGNFQRYRFEAMIELAKVFRHMGNCEHALNLLGELEIARPKHFEFVRITLEKFMCVLYSGNIQNEGFQFDEILTSLTFLPPTFYDLLVNEVFLCIFYSNLPLTAISNLPAPPTDDLAIRLGKLLKSSEQLSDDLTVKLAQSILTSMEIAGSNIDVWCTALLIFLKHAQPIAALRFWKSVENRLPNDVYFSGVIFSEIAKIYIQNLNDPHTGRSMIERAIEQFSKLNNALKLAECELILDSIIASPLGGDAALLLDVAKALTSTLDWKELATIVLDTTINVSGARRALLISVENEQFLPVFLRADSNSMIDVTGAQFSNSAVKSALRAGHALLVENVPASADLSSQDSILDLRIFMVIVIPLIVRNKTIGVLYADADVRHSKFSQRTVKLLETLGEFAAMTLSNAKQYEELAAERDAFRAQTNKFFGDDFVSGHSEIMKHIYPKIIAISAQDITVLLYGETGVGKDVIARLVHSNSIRAKKPFVALNCAAIPETLLEAELFGYEKGAFTGAVRRQPGKLELANSGTLFLDEIGDMSPALQSKLLSVIEFGTFMTLGGREVIKSDVRIISATNKNLLAEIENAQFREDLYYRISTVRVRIPALRERREDIPEFAYHFLQMANKKFNKQILNITREAMNILCAYSWPGNIRQLKNAIDEMSLFTIGDTITTDLIPDYILDQPISQSSVPVPDGFIMPDSYSAYKIAKSEIAEKYEAWTVQQLLEKYRYNVSRAAREFGIHRTRLHQLITKHGINGENFDSSFEVEQ